MNIKVFEPRSGEVAHESVGIVMFNHVGSTVSQDTGRDAQAYADGLQTLVIAADRPGTAGVIPNKELAATLSTPPGYVTEVAKVGKRIDKQLGNLGIRSALVAGRSAGGLAALALTRSETVGNQTHLFAAEPVACEDMTVDEGYKRFKENNSMQQRLKQHDADEYYMWPHNEPLMPLPLASRMLSMVPAFYFDKYHNQRIWASDAAIRYAEHIAWRQQEIDATLEFAYESFVAKPDIYRDRLEPLGKLRNDFVVRKSERTTHASYDSHDFMIGLLAPIVARASIR